MSYSQPSSIFWSSKQSLPTIKMTQSSVGCSVGSDKDGYTLGWILGEKLGVLVGMDGVGKFEGRVGVGMNVGVEDGKDVNGNVDGSVMLGSDVGT